MPYLSTNGRRMRGIKEKVPYPSTGGRGMRGGALGGASAEVGGDEGVRPGTMAGRQSRGRGSTAWEYGRSAKTGMRTTTARD